MTTTYSPTDSEQQFVPSAELQFDAAPDMQKEAFADRLLDSLNSGTMTHMLLAIGHRTGLLDTMVSLSASSSQQIVAAAYLNERYVREWLGAIMVYQQNRSPGPARRASVSRTLFSSQ